jgi:hypothetical protein
MYNMINNGKATIEKTFGGLNIIIPSKKNWFALLFGTAWLGGWFFGLLSASNMLFPSRTEHFGTNGFMIFWLIGWTTGGLGVIGYCCGDILGKKNLVQTKTKHYWQGQYSALD